MNMETNKKAIKYKAESHNDIILQLDKITLINIFNSYFGDKSSWSGFHFIHQKELKDYTLSEVNQIVQKFREEIDKTKDLKLSELKEIYSKHNKAIEDTDIINSLIVKTNFEFPIIKGEDQYQVTKGFIDLIVHIKPLKIGDFCCYKNEEPKEFVIEIKKEKDFDDFGNILRQIKEYREYYYSCGIKKCNSEIMEDDERKYNPRYPQEDTSYFCIIADKIPEKVKKIFDNENIITISLADYKQLKQSEEGKAQHSSQA